MSLSFFIATWFGSGIFRSVHLQTKLSGALQDSDTARPLNVSSFSPLQYSNLPLQALLLRLLFLPRPPALSTKWENNFILLEFDLTFQHSGGLLKLCFVGVKEVRAQSMFALLRISGS